MIGAFTLSALALTRPLTDKVCYLVRLSFRLFRLRSWALSFRRMLILQILYQVAGAVLSFDQKKAFWRNARLELSANSQCAIRTHLLHLRESEHGLLCEIVVARQMYHYSPFVQ